MPGERRFQGDEGIGVRLTARLAGAVRQLGSDTMPVGGLPMSHFGWLGSPVQPIGGVALATYGN
jgi:hypothetical protein